MTDEVIRFEYGPKNQHRPWPLDLPAPTVMARGLGGVREYQALLPSRGEVGADPETGESLTPIKARPIPGWRKFTIQELRRLCSFPDDFALTGDYQQRWERLGRAVPPLMMAAIACTVTRLLLADPEEPVMPTAKPPYRVPSMEEIRALPWNGMNAVSTFSGCGGSSLGYRMAGFRVLWASEFIAAARDSYRANAAPYTVLDDRDIREVSGADILAAIGMGVGELDLFDGSPPCASFSTAGKREAGWNKVKKYSDTEQRTDDLFYEYARLIRDVQPKVFVAENVSGLVKGTAKGYFLRILKELRGCGYRVQAKLLDAQWLGVPQARQRLIFIGVRNDLNRDPVFPTPLPYRYSVREALPWILQQGDNGGFGAGQLREATQPSGTIGATPNTGNGAYPPSMVTAARVVHDTSGDRSMGDVTDRPSPTVTVGVNAVNSNHYQVRGPAGDGWVAADPETGKQLVIGGARKNMLPDGLGPDRRVRRFTLQELRAICGFPQDFTLTGTYEQRWERLGRAVPPVMMARIAAAVRDRILLNNLIGGVA